MPIVFPIWQAVVLAIVQGIAEFLPISSTAHLILFPWLFGWTDPGLTFDVALHAGTLLAVIGYFFMTWVRIIRAGFGAPVDIHTGRILSGAALEIQRRLLWFLVLATLPAAVAGYLFEKKIETTWRNPLVIAVSLIGVGILMALADWLPDRVPPREAEASAAAAVDAPAASAGAARPALATAAAAADAVHGLKDFDQVSLLDSLWIGVSQALAVIPGVSRSGITITFGLFRGLSREAAARFSFILATPIIAGAALKKGLEVHKQGLPPAMHAAFAVGIVVSALVGIASIQLFIRFLRLRTLRFFVWYRILLGVFILLWAWHAHTALLGAL